MLDMLNQTLPNTKIYVQSITPVRPEVSQKSGHEGLNRDRLYQINNELAAIALEKDCYFLNLWEVLADENGDLIESYAQPDGYHCRVKRTRGCCTEFGAAAPCCVGRFEMPSALL